MTRNRKFFLITFLLVTVGLLSVSFEAQLPAKRVSRVGRNRDAQPIAILPASAQSQEARAQSSINFSFGLVDFPRSPDGALRKA